MLAISAGGIAAIVAAVSLAVLVVFLALALFNLFRVLESTKSLLDGVREQTLPLLAEVKVAVTAATRDLEHAGGVMESAGHITKSVERITTALEHAVATPLIKIAAVGAGLSAAASRLRKER